LQHHVGRPAGRLLLTEGHEGVEAGKPGELGGPFGGVAEQRQQGVGDRGGLGGTPDEFRDRVVAEDEVRQQDGLA